MNTTDSCEIETSNCFFLVNKKQVIEKYTNNDKKKVEFEDFIPSEIFAGRKSGYVFKTDNKGTGYYLDG